VSEPGLSRPDGLVFDLDGTLVDTVGARIDGWLEALVAAGIPVSRLQVAPMIGMDGKRLARLVAEAAGRTPSEEELEALDHAAGRAFDRFNVAPRPLPGVPDVLAAADEAGCHWVIATSSRAEQVVRSVEALHLPTPPTIVDGSHVEHAKPAPDLLLLAAERLESPRDRCWAVGDSTWDMRAAVAAGMTAVAVSAGSAVGADELRAAGAAVVVRTLGDLADRLRTAQPAPRSVSATRAVLPPG
jgi:HAD superfamily hydrolase (TIGR01509 family)